MEPWIGHSQPIYEITEDMYILTNPSMRVFWIWCRPFLDFILFSGIAYLILYAVHNHDYNHMTLYNEVWLCCYMHSVHPRKHLKAGPTKLSCSHNYFACTRRRSKVNYTCLIDDRLPFMLVSQLKHTTNKNCSRILDFLTIIWSSGWRGENTG